MQIIRLDRLQRLRHRQKWLFRVGCGVLALLLTLLLAMGWAIAQEEPEKPALESWQLRGILAALKDQDPLVWAEALNKLAEFDLETLQPNLMIPESVYQQTISIFDDPKNPPKARSAAARALGGMGEAAADQAPKLVAVFTDADEDEYVRSAAARALGEMGEAAADQAPKLVAVFTDGGEDEYVRSAAAYALGVMGEAAADQVPKLVAVLTDGDEDVDVRSAAARALGEMGEAAAGQAPRLAEVVADANADEHVRSAAARALEGMGEAAAGQASEVATLLQNQTSFTFYLPWEGYYMSETVSLAAAEALSQMGPASNEILIQALNAVNLNQPIAQKFRFLAYYLSDSRKDALTLIWWLGVRDEVFAPDYTKISHREAVQTLQVFADAWPADNKLPRKIEIEWPRHIANIVESADWKTSNLPLLRKHYSNLKAIGSTHAAAVQDAITTLEWWRGVWISRDVWFSHVAFWGLLIFVYPKSPQIQAIFFWNPWIRRITGLGYVGFALTWIPFLRARLFAPFQDSLLASAGLAGFTPQAYFPDSTVKNKATGAVQLLQEAIPAIKGQLILEGESGLGKSMFLRHVIQQTLQRQLQLGRLRFLQDLIRPTPIMVFLPADRCAQGVSEAIQGKLHGLAKDPNFLRDLIYSGAIDICIDGLNEVTADTRAKITEFVEHYFKGNIIMTTQPLEWRPPATATTYVLQPLAKEKVQEFLCSREPTLLAEASVRGEAYFSACTDYLKGALSPQQPLEELITARRTLSNPMDLSLVAQMIGNGETPNLFRLQVQQYKLMATEYQRLHPNEFPLERFSECVYNMRRQEQTAIPEAEFYEELQCMERHKMVTCRQGIDSEGKPTREWNFRHDKIMEYFIVQTFLGKENDRPQQHLGDPRFRGVYFLLAKLMPLEDALALREQVINHAADTRDHTVSDDFIQLLRTRRIAA